MLVPILLLLTWNAPAAALFDDRDEAAREIERSRIAEREAISARGASRAGTAPRTPIGAITNPLFVGVDDAAIPAELIDPTGVNTNVQVPLAIQYWGAAFDVSNNTVYLSSGSNFHHWVVGTPAVTTIGLFTSSVDAATLVMEGLAVANGTLYGSRVANTATNPEGIYSIDPATGVATLVEAFAATANQTVSGLDADPLTGTLYGTNDVTNASFRGLIEIPLDGSGTFVQITDYPAGETDIDGLAIGTDGRAYLVEDDGTGATGQIHVWDLGLAAYQTPIPTPWATSEVFSAGAWIYEAGGASISLNKTVGIVPATCAPTDSITVTTGTTVYYCYEVENTGSVTFEFHDLVDDQLGQLLDDEPVTLAPGATYQHIESDVAGATVTNTGTWTAADALSGYQFDDTVANGFVDISGTGTALNLADDGEANITLAFPFELYGVASTDIRVSNNGVLLHNTTAGDVPFTNTALPSGGLPAAAIATYWDDLDDESGNVFHQGFGVAPDRTHVVQWHQRPHFPGPNADTATFQVVLHETSNEIEYFYQDTTFGDPATDNGASATVGTQFDAALANQFSFDTPASIADDEALLVTLGTVVEASAQDTATVTISDPDIAVDPTSLSSLIPADTQETQQLDIDNNGSATLDWDFTESSGLSAGRPVTLAAGRQELVRTQQRMASPRPSPAAIATRTFSRAADDLAGKLNQPTRPEVPDGTVTITHSATQNIVSLNSVSCNAGGLHTDNSYIRAFDLGAFGITTDFEIVQVEVGVEQAVGAGGTQPVTVNLYTWNPADPFTFANFSIIGTANASVPDQNLTILAVPVAGTAPAGSTLVVELFTPNGQTAGHSFFVGSNPDGQTAPTFLAAADCGVPEPTDTAVIGFPNMHVVMNVSGTAGCNEDLTWISTSPSSGSTAAGGTSTVDVTFDATGLTGGDVLTGSLCVNSNDPDTPTLLVPVTLTVDAMPFLADFEEGDLSEWSSSQP
jgi:hypothetical protein